MSERPNNKPLDIDSVLLFRNTDFLGVCSPGWLSAFFLHHNKSRTIDLRGLYVYIFESWIVKKNSSDPSERSSYPIVVSYRTISQLPLTRYPKPLNPDVNASILAPPTGTVPAPAPPRLLLCVLPSLRNQLQSWSMSMGICCQLKLFVGRGKLLMLSSLTWATGFVAEAGAAGSAVKLG